MEIGLNEKKKPVVIPSLMDNVPNEILWSKVIYVLVKHKELGYLQIEDNVPKWVKSDDPYDEKHLRLETGDTRLDLLPDEGSPSLQELRDGKAVFVPFRAEICWMHVVEPATGRKKKRYAKEWIANNNFTIPDLEVKPIREGWTFRGWSYKGKYVNHLTEFTPEDAGGTIYADFLQNF